MGLKANKIEHKKHLPYSYWRLVKRASVRAIQVAEEGIDIGKQLIGLADDFWAVIRQILPKLPIMKMIGASLTGFLAVVIGVMEGKKGLERFIKGCKAYLAKIKNDQTHIKIPQLKTRMTSGGLVFLLGMLVVSLGAVIIAGVAGLIALVNVPVFTLLIAGALTTLYGVSLWKDSYVWQQAKQLFRKAKEDLEKNKNTYQEQGQYESKKQECDRLYEKVLEKEAKVAFAVIETATMLVVTVAALLTVAAFIGLGIASFGIIPLALTIVAAGISVGCKIFESLDNQKDELGNSKHELTRKTRNFFVSVGKSIKNFFSFKGQNNLELKDQSSLSSHPTYRRGSTASLYNQEFGVPEPAAGQSVSENISQPPGDRVPIASPNSSLGLYPSLNQALLSNSSSRSTRKNSDPEKCRII